MDDEWRFKCNGLIESDSLLDNTNECEMRKAFIYKFKRECINLVFQHKDPVTPAAEIMNIGTSPRTLRTAFASSVKCAWGGGQDH
nr:hypothetical protein D1p2_00003 [Serratia entomophila]ULG12314.1 hypothetical protein M3p_00016 [Serratia entomophila]